MKNVLGVGLNVRFLYDSKYIRVVGDEKRLSTAIVVRLYRRHNVR